MSETDTELSGAETSRGAASLPEWLEPTAALSAFQPAEGEASITSAAEEHERRYGFRIANLNFVVGRGVRTEVVRDPDIAGIPHSPSWLLGLINQRSNLVPVFDLQDLCGLGATPLREQAMLLVLGAGEKAVGVPISALPVPMPRLKRILPLPPLIEPLRGFVESAYAAGGDEVWLELNHEQCVLSVARKQ